MDFLQTLAAVAAVIVPLVGLQTFWIARSLDAIGGRLERVDRRLEHIDQAVLREHGERIARLEARTSS